MNECPQHQPLPDHRFAWVARCSHLGVYALTEIDTEQGPLWIDLYASHGRDAPAARLASWSFSDLESPAEAWGRMLALMRAAGQ